MGTLTGFNHEIAIAKSETNIIGCFPLIGPDDCRRRSFSTYPHSGYRRSTRGSACNRYLAAYHPRVVPQRLPMANGPLRPVHPVHPDRWITRGPEICPI